MTKTAMGRRRALRDYHTQYTDPIVLRQRDEVVVGREDAEWPGWLWCTAGDGRQGWVPAELLDRSGDRAQARSDYTARELDVRTGEVVDVLEERNGWIRCRSAEGREGWVPVRDLERVRDGRGLRILPLALWWLIGAAAAAWTARMPNPYLEHVAKIPPPHPYPTESVAWIILLMALETAAVAAILRPHSYRRSWRRALAALVVAVAFVMFAALGAMHAPPYYSVYLGWLLVVLVGLLGLLVWSAIGAVQARHSARTTLPA